MRGEFVEVFGEVFGAEGCEAVVVRFICLESEDVDGFGGR